MRYFPHPPFSALRAAGIAKVLFQRVSSTAQTKISKLLRCYRPPLVQLFKKGSRWRSSF